MEKPEKIGVTYLSYKDFISNYNNDFKEWQKHYPDGEEVDYLDFLEDNLCYKTYSNNSNILHFSEYIKINSTEIHYSDFIFEIERCLEIYMEEEGNLKTEQDVKNTLNNWGIQWALNRGLYGLDYQTLKYYTPFLKIDNIFELLEDTSLRIYFDDKKYKNFEISARRVIEFIETRREQLKNQPAPVVSEEPQLENITPLQWNGTDIEFIELAKALEVSGVVTSEKHPFINIVRVLKKAFNFDLAHPNKKANDIKLRKIGGETLFLDKLQKELKDKWINKEK
ncbi:RteC domain-containing protein [Capnocytophaga stomatis]|uniref:RteC domain-containing protein n=1 Tax=Capnocytophaga stomatis TaxID=1848904 RepID=UPI003858DF75